MELADRIRALRKQLKLTQEELGLLIQSTRVDVVHLERGRRRLSGHDARLRFAKGIGIPTALLDSYIAGDLAVDAVASLAEPTIAQAKERWAVAKSGTNPSEVA